MGRHFLWQIEPADSEMKGVEGRAIRRTILPPGLGANTTIGIRLHLWSSDTVPLSVQAFSNVDPINGFFGAKSLGSGVKQVRAGEQDVTILWNEVGVFQRDLAEIQGYGLTIRQAPVTLAISRVELVFASADEASEYESRRDAKLRKLQKVMVDSLAASGVDLSTPFSELFGDGLEQRIWQAAHLIGMAEQLDNWSRLAALHGSDGGGRKLEGQRRELVLKLERGDIVQDGIDNLQTMVDRYVDKWITELPVEKRRWRVGEDERFYRPDGRPYRMYGPFFHRSRFGPEEAEIMRWWPWDIRYVAALGFNGVRIIIHWRNLEPSQGIFDDAQLQMLKDICREAERYGLGLSIDLHWAFPEWFDRGKPGMEVEDGGYLHGQNSYQWPEALVETWRHLAAEFKDVPNIVAFEVPTNEPPIAASPRGVLATPTLNRSWNDWLQRAYGTREKLTEVWGAAAEGAERYRLREDESWEDATIVPLGFQDDPDRDTAYAYNPRFWDHIRWVAWLQRDVTGRIMSAIHESIPDAVGMMQRTIGGRHDRSPVPIAYRSIQTIAGAHVRPGTHYGMGGIQARKAVTQTLLSYDSEQQMEGRQGQVERHVDLGLGFCPFDFFYHARGGQLFADHHWHLKPSVAFLFQMTDRIRNYWPEAKTGARKVAVVTNTRLASTEGLSAESDVFPFNGRVVDELIAILDQLDCQVGVFEGLAVAQQPELLDGYPLVITTSAYMDVDLLAVLDEEFDGSVLLFGRLDFDAHARRPEKGLLAAMVERGILFSRPSTGQFETAGEEDSPMVWVADRLDPVELRLGARAARLHAEDMHSNVEVMARVGGDGEDSPPAFVRQGRWFWWIGDSWSKEAHVEESVLNMVLDSLSDVYE